MAKQFKFHVEHPGERAAGIMSFTDDVTVTVENDTGNDEDFTEHMRLSLKEWFDGAAVLTADEHRAQQEKLDRLMGPEL